MRTLIGLVFAVAACVMLTMELALLADPAGFWNAFNTFPFAPAPWQAHAGVFAAAAILGWMATRLLSGGILGRLVRGRGLTPEPARR